MKTPPEPLTVEWLAAQHPDKSFHRQRRVAFCSVIAEHIGATACANSLPHQLHRLSSHLR